ncbi:MAG: sigma 54-interacting transcriptional regulator [Candidatus Omnitrophica bacterium]|nr:sigma 54-interacting transcriptional regulator [Candidatus Omnitrophota bacterium]
MEAPAPMTPLFPDPKRLLLDMAEQHRVEDLLHFIVRELSRSEYVVLARIWLLRPGEGCATCPMASECPDRTSCLHLVASSGGSALAPESRYARLDGNFRRFPLGVRKIGRIASTGQPIEVPDITRNHDWVAQPDWVETEGIAGFGGQPLIHKGEVIGVLAIFSRGRIGQACLDWLRMFADHAAGALANARAWEEIESLREKLQLENEYLQEEVEQSQSFGEMIGGSPALQAIGRQIELVAPTESNVLIQGESGTGKELIAREIHRRSCRSDRPLIKVNCAAIPRELYESEFFGHSRGSFTGAVRDRVGRFELANGGTLFLDEVGEIPIELQSKLLRVLQEGELERVGEERTRKVDVRVIAATNRNLREEAEAGRFRTDLYYRLNVFPIEMVPLRERREDIPLLADHFLQIFSRRLGRSVPRMTLANVQDLQRYGWPGNIRELQHVIERSVITAADGKLRFDLPEQAVSEKRKGRSQPASSKKILTEAELRDIEAANIQLALEQTGGKIYGSDGAAAILGVRPTTLSSRIKTLGLRKNL